MKPTAHKHTNDDAGMNLYKEEDFYKDKGWPAEEYLYCNFTLPVDSVSEYGPDYNQFLLVVNSLNPYPFTKL